MEQLMNLDQNSTITSIDLVKQINTFRQMFDDDSTELLHKTFLRKIRILQHAQKQISGGEVNILPSEYKDNSGKSNPMFELSNDIAVMLAADESPTVKLMVAKWIKNARHELQKPVENKIYSIEDFARSLLESKAKVKELTVENNELNDNNDKLKKVIRLKDIQVDKYETILSDPKNKGVGETAKILYIGSVQDLYAWLRYAGYCLKKKYEAMQLGIDKGYFETKYEEIISKNGKVTHVTSVVVTPKGFDYLNGISKEIRKWVTDNRRKYN